MKTNSNTHISTPLYHNRSNGRKNIPSFNFLKCHKCGMFGQTFIETDNHYECQDKTRCILWQTGAKALDKTPKVVV